MKKSLFLTSLLILAACGGGGGGSGASADKGRPSDTLHRIVSEDTYKSNRKITPMVSRILVSQADPTRSLARTGSVEYAGAMYDEYDLSNVSFAVADEGLDTDGMKLVIDPETKEIVALDMGFGGEDGYPTLYKFVKDENGNITDLEEVSDAANAEPDLDTKKYLFRKSSDTNEFIGYVNHGGDQNTEEPDATELTDGERDGANWVKTTAKYNSLGDAQKLRYSDFGNIEIAAIPGWRAMFIGGYDVKKIAPEQVTETTEFNGHATGSVIALRNNTEGKAIELDDKSAKLTFDKASGTSTMTAKFDNWYDVEYSEKHSDGANGKTIKLSNYAPDESAPNENYFRLLSDESETGFISDTLGEDGKPVGITMHQDTYTEHDETANRIESDVRYFGDNNVATEGVALIQLRDCADGVCGMVQKPDYDDNGNQIGSHGVRSDEIRMNIGFGGKHDNPSPSPRRN